MNKTYGMFFQITFIAFFTPVSFDEERDVPNAWEYWLILAIIGSLAIFDFFFFVFFPLQMNIFLQENYFGNFHKFYESFEKINDQRQAIVV